MAQQYIKYEDKVDRVHKLKNALPCIEFDYSLDSYYGFFYAQDGLYILQDCMVDGYYFINADSPQKAIQKLHERFDEAMQAGSYVEEDYE